MFRDLVTILGGGVANANNVLTQYTPSELSAYLELVWNAPRNVARNWDLPALQVAPNAPQAFHRGMARIPAEITVAPPVVPANVLAQDEGFHWPHLISAFLIDQTGIGEAMRRVLVEWNNDERLPFASLESQYWMRATEELFFTSPSPAFHSLTSSLRPDALAIRENAYQRLFGLELSWRRGQAANYTRARTFNGNFVRTLERLLSEIWRGFINVANAGTENRTDIFGMDELVRDLRQMLMARRVNGTLLREEFSAIAVTNWHFLTVEYNTFVVNNLNAQSTSAANRLQKIAALVGMQSSRHSDSYFQLVDPLSDFLISVETGLIEALGMPDLYDAALNAPLTANMQAIIHHWELATGRPIKDVSFNVFPGVGVPQRPAVAAGTNRVGSFELASI